MKKMIFSAVALVAFSFAGMANEIEEKKVELKTTETIKVEVLEEKVILRNNCDVWADSWYNFGISQGLSVSEAHDLSIDAYQGCIKDHEENNKLLTIID